MIEIIDLKQKKQSNCRAMLCQIDATLYHWKLSSGLSLLQPSEKLKSKILEFLNIARQNSVDLILFPENSIPETFMKFLQEWSSGQNAIAICGSHYHRTEYGYISRCPIIINGTVYFTEKISPSPFERSPIIGEGLQSGSKILKFVNTMIGNFAILICADYLNANIKREIILDDLDLLCTPVFQRDSNVYFSRINTDVVDSKSGLYILYANCIETKMGDGRSAVFGLMDRIFTKKLKERNFTDCQPANKLYEFGNDNEFIITELDLENKRPFINHNLDSIPNVQFLPVSHSMNAFDLKFSQKVARDDERYQRIDDLYVPPKEFAEILSTLESKNIVFIVGDPGIGKTYSAAKLLKHYYKEGYEPIWFAGLEKEDRELQSKVLTEFIPANKQVVYFEDPFGKTVFERRDSLFQVFAPLMEKLSRLDSKVIITSRKEPFEKFSHESLLEREVLKLKRELNVRNPSYEKEDLFNIFKKLAEITCNWSDDQQLVTLVNDAIIDGKLTTPLALRELIFAHKDRPSIKILKQSIERREDDTIKVFALEIRETILSTKIVLYLAMLGGNKGKAALAEIYEQVARELQANNYTVGSFSFAIEVRSQLGYRLELAGYFQNIYKFTHPVYEEALATLITADPLCELTAKLIITEIAKIDSRHAYRLINRFVVKYPEMALSLFQYLHENEKQIADGAILLTLARKLIATYFVTKNEDYFKLANQCYPLNQVVNDLNSQHFTPTDLIPKLNLIQRYLNNSPENYDTTLIKTINWTKVFTNEKNVLDRSSKVLVLFEICASIDQDAVPNIIRQKGINFLKQVYFLLESTNREQFKLILEKLEIDHHLNQYDDQLAKIEKETTLNRFRFFKKVLFTDYQYVGKVFIDDGAKYAIRRNWVNLLPAGITKVESDFSAGDIIGVYDSNNVLIGVGISEYDSSQLHKLQGHSSSQFQELIGYYHVAAAIQARYLFKFSYEFANEVKLWKYQPRTII